LVFGVVGLLNFRSLKAALLFMKVLAFSGTLVLQIQVLVGVFCAHLKKNEKEHYHQVSTNPEK